MVEIFGDVDRDRDKKVKSTYPAYYFRQQTEDLEESIRQRKTALENDVVQGPEKMIQKERLKQEEEKLTKINDSKPRLSSVELDLLGKVRKSIGQKIKEAMFSDSEMRKGLADAHEEARRMSTPCIRLDENEISIAKSCDVTVFNDGKVTRTGAEKTWKIISRLLDEQSNTEALRKP